MPQSIGRSGSELRRRKAGNHQEGRINSEEVAVLSPLAFFCNTETLKEEFEPLLFPHVSLNPRHKFRSVLNHYVSNPGRKRVPQIQTSVVAHHRTKIAGRIHGMPSPVRSRPRIRRHRSQRPQQISSIELGAARLGMCHKRAKRRVHPSAYQASIVRRTRRLPHHRRIQNLVQPCVEILTMLCRRAVRNQPSLSHFRSMNIRLRNLQRRACLIHKLVQRMGISRNQRRRRIWKGLQILAYCTARSQQQETNGGRCNSFHHTQPHLARPHCVPDVY